MQKTNITYKVVVVGRSGCTPNFVLHVHLNIERPATLNITITTNSFNFNTFLEDGIARAETGLELEPCKPGVT